VVGLSQGAARPLAGPQTPGIRRLLQPLWYQATLSRVTWPRSFLLFLVLVPLALSCHARRSNSNIDDDDTVDTGDDDTDDPGDDDDDSGHGSDDDDSSAETVFGSVDIITMTTDQDAGGVRVYYLDDPANDSITDSDGCWDITFPRNLQVATVVTEAEGYEEARFHLDLTWQRDRTEDMIFFNVFRTDEFGPFMSKVFGLTTDPTRGILEVGVKSRSLGPRLAGATVNVTNLAYDMVVTANDEPSETNVTTDDGTNFFMNIEPGMAEITVQGPGGEDCVGLTPVEVVADSLTHVIFQCD